MNLKVVWLSVSCSVRREKDAKFPWNFKRFYNKDCASSIDKSSWTRSSYCNPKIFISILPALENTKKKNRRKWKKRESGKSTIGEIFSIGEILIRNLYRQLFPPFFKAEFLLRQLFPPIPKSGIFTYPAFSPIAKIC